MHRCHCICFQEATGLPCFAMIGNGRVHRLLGTRRKVKICRRKRSLHRTVLSLRGSLLLRLDEGQLTSASSAHLTVESYDRIVQDSSCVHWKSKVQNSDRWLALQIQKKDNRSNKEHTRRSRFSPAMPRTSFLDNLRKSGLFYKFKAGPPLEAILVIFGRRALIFFWFERSSKKIKNDTTFVRMRSRDHLGDAKMSKMGTSLRRI